MDTPTHTYTPDPEDPEDPEDQEDPEDREDPEDPRTGYAGYVSLHAIQGHWSSKKNAREFAVKYLQKFSGRVAQLRASNPTDIVGQFEKAHAVRQFVAKVAHCLPPILSVDKIIISKCKTLLEGVMMTYFPLYFSCPPTVYKLFIESKIDKSLTRLTNVRQHVATTVKKNMVKFYFFINILNEKYKREYMDKLLIDDLIANGDQTNANVVQNLSTAEMEEWFPTIELLPNSLPNMCSEDLLVQVCPFKPMQDQFDHLLRMCMKSL